MKNRRKLFAVTLGLGFLLFVVIQYYLGVVDPAAEKIYVPNAGEGTVSVINARTRVVEQTLKIADTVSHGLGVSSDNNYLFTGDLDDGNIYVVDTSAGTIVKTIEVGERTHGIDISPDGKYVVVASGRGGGSHLAVIDTELQEMVTSIEDGLLGPTHITFSPDGKRAYVADPEQNAVVVIDMVTLTTESVWPTGAEGAQEARTSPNGEFLYVANYEGNALTVLDTLDGSVLFTVPAGEQTHAVDVSPDGRFVWVVAAKTGEVFIFDAENEYADVETLQFDRPNHVTFHPGGDEVYITDTGNNLLVVVHAHTYEILAEIALGQTPHEITIVAE